MKAGFRRTTNGKWSSVIQVGLPEPKGCMPIRRKDQQGEKGKQTLQEKFGRPKQTMQTKALKAIPPGSLIFNRVEGKKEGLRRVDRKKTVQKKNARNKVNPSEENCARRQGGR